MTQMASHGASSLYMCDLNGSRYVLIMIELWGSEIVFLSIGLDDHSSIILRYFQALIYLTYKLYLSLSIYSGFRLGRTYISNLHLSSPSESW